MLWVSDAVATAYELDLSVVAGAARSLGLLLFAAMLWRAVVRLLFGGSKTDGRLLHDQRPDGTRVPRWPADASAVSVSSASACFMPAS